MLENDSSTGGNPVLRGTVVLEGNPAMNQITNSHNSTVLTRNPDLPVRVLSLSPRREYELKALATVGIGPIELRGVRVIMRTDGRMVVQMPKITAPGGGYWWPITITDPELLETISDAVLACYRDSLALLGRGTGGRR